MAGSLNKIMLIGNVGRDPELRFSKNGEPFATFTLATTYSYKPNGGDRVDQTEWHKLVVWRQLAEQAGKYVKKGRKLYIEGRVQSRQYQDNNDVQKTSYEIVVTQMEFLDSPKDSVAEATPASNGASRPVAKARQIDDDEFLDLSDAPF